MQCNVWKIGKLRWTYYLVHPWKLVADFALSVKWAHQRATKGYADVDWFNLCDWMTEVIPQMFEAFAKDHCGYPGEEAGFSDDQWTAYLCSIALHMKNASEDQKTKVNQYEEQWSIMSDDQWKKLKRWTDEDGHIHHEWPPLSDEQKILRDKYFAREKEILDWRLAEAQAALKLIGERFFDLWD